MKVKVKFKPTAMLPAYRKNVGSKENQQQYACLTAGEYDLPEEIAEEVCNDFPDNFTAVGATKSAGKPSHNRAAPPPGKDK